MNVFDLKTKKPTALCFSEVGPVCEKKNKKTKKRQENCGNDHKFAKGEISLG